MPFIKGQKQNWTQWNKGQGKAIKWLQENAAYDGDNCLTWPFGKCEGYGMFGVNGDHWYAHRFMCKLVHGEPPTPAHVAAHECGKGHLGCVNPKHLSWKTISENQKDRSKHGTSDGAKGPYALISIETINEMRALAGRMSQREMARRFNVKRGCVQYWLKQDKNPAPRRSRRGA